MEGDPVRILAYGILSSDMGLILNLTNNLGEQVVRLTMSKLRMNVKAAPVIGVALGALLLSATAVGLAKQQTFRRVLQGRIGSHPP